MINETTWFYWLVSLGDADKISEAIVKEINDKTDQPLQLFLFYGLNPDTITQTEYEEMIGKILKLKPKR
jgi:hypothetical protein